MKTIELKATIENYSRLLNWWHEIAVCWNLSNDLTSKIDVCIEEIYTNIASYAYKNKAGFTNISIDKKNNEIILNFKDEGIEYNPLQKEDPDITLSLEERPIGGLGIFMVKEISKSIEYKRENNRNILTLKFDTN